MESMKLVQELSILSTTIDCNLLLHFFSHFDPSSSKCYAITMKNFNIPHLEQSDYRSAYHQLCDWLYGWNVSDNFSLDDSSGGLKTSKRTPRKIDLTIEIESAECERILATFQTLLYFSHRQLQKHIFSIEARLQNVGRGIQTAMSGINVVGDTDNEMDRIWALQKPSSDETQADDIADLINSNTSLNDAVESLLKSNNKGYTVKAAAPERSDSVNSMDFVPPPMIMVEGEDPQTDSKNESAIPNLRNGNQISNSIAGLNTPGVTKSKGSTMNMFQESGKGSNWSMFDSNSEKVPSTEPFRFLQPAMSTSLDNLPESSEEKSSFLRRDLNLVLNNVDQSTDYTLLCLVNILVIMSFSELLGKKDIHQKTSATAHQMASGFISNTLKAVYDLLNKQFPDEIQFHHVRDLDALRLKLKEMIRLWTEAIQSENPGAEAEKSNYRFSKLHRKFEFLNELFTALDIHIFPRFVHAHKEGCKAAAFSDFDSALWLTGGYDGIIRIHDLRKSQPTGVDVAPLAQFIGHRSIVSEVHFTRKDSHIVSCSFDRTVKVWSSQNGTCEKTLLGHTDSVTCCHITRDARYIASGSMDCSVRLWDLSSGECLCVIKKHSRWIKAVRFSPDGRYLASAGLDRKMYIWDVRLLLNGKSIAPTRCFESHIDTVLDMVVVDPAILISSSRDSTVRVSDITTGRELHIIDLAPSWACSVAASECGTFFATGSFDNSINLFRTKTGEHIRHIRVFNLGILCVRFPIDLEYLVVGGNEGFLQQIPL